MNKTIRTVAFLSALSILSTGCKKEEILMEPEKIVEQATAVYNVTYTVNDVEYNVSFSDEKSYYDFIFHLIGRTQSGDIVNIRLNNVTCPYGFKEVVTYTTTSHDEATEWSIKMMNEGYSVVVVFDEKTGIYTCTATR